jgi:hypothetical protein
MWNISFIIMWPLHNQAYCNISMKNGSKVIIRLWLSYIGPLIFLLPETFIELYGFQMFCFERHLTKVITYLMKVILSIPDEGYSEPTWWRLFWAYLMKVILSLPDEGYSEPIWWRLFWAYPMKVILSLPDEGYSEPTWWRLFWAYLMNVILSLPDEGYSRIMSCALNLISTFLLWDKPPSKKLAQIFNSSFC